MYIIVIGGGKVGYYLSFALLSKGHEVLIIEREAGKCKAIAEDLGSVVMHGDGAEVRTLEDAGAGRADLLIAVTRRDEVNLVACQVAKHKFGIRRTIARVSNPKDEALFKMLGIDVTVSSTSLILEQIEERMPKMSSGWGGWSMPNHRTHFRLAATLGGWCCHISTDDKTVE